MSPALLAFALPLALYLFTLAPSLLNDDPAEYQALLPVLGVTHPTGYPLYTLLGHLFTLSLPVGDMAFRVNLFSALAGAAAIGAVYLLLRALAVSTLPALLGALALAVSSTTWTYATIAQTYALNTLLMAAALGAALYAQRRKDWRSLALLGFASGLGAAHHSTFWLLLPALAAFVLIDPGLRTSLFRRSALRLWAAALLSFAAPLLLYAYIPIRGEQLLVESPRTLLSVPAAVANGVLTAHYLSGWTNVVIGSFYAGSTLGGASVDWAKGIGDYLAGLNAQFHGFELLALGLLFPAVWRRNRPFVLALVLAWFINVVVVLRGVSAFDEPAGGLYTPTYLFCAIALVLVLDSAARLLEARVPTAIVGMNGHAAPPLLRCFSQRGRLGGGLASALLLIICAWSLLQNFQSHNLRAIAAAGSLAFHDWATSELSRADVPTGAVVFGSWSEVTPLHYVQLVEGLRPDVTVLQSPLASPLGREFIQRALVEGRMPFLVTAPWQPFLPVAYKMPVDPGHPLQAAFGNELTLLGYDVSGGPLSTQSLRLTWRTERTPAADYKVFVHLLDAAGNQVAGADHPPVSEYFPTSSWPPGLYFVDRCPLPVPSVEVRALDIGLYDPIAGTRLALPDGTTSVRIPLP